MKGFNNLKKIIDKNNIPQSLIDSIVSTSLNHNKQINKLYVMDKKIDKTLTNLPYEIDSLIYKEQYSKLKKKEESDKDDDDDDQNNDNGGMKIPVTPFPLLVKKIRL